MKLHLPNIITLKVGETGHSNRINLKLGLKTKNHKKQERTGLFKSLFTRWIFGLKVLLTMDFQKYPNMLSIKQNKKDIGMTKSLNFSSKKNVLTITLRENNSMKGKKKKKEG